MIEILDDMAGHKKGNFWLNLDVLSASEKVELNDLWKKYEKY